VVADGRLEGLITTEVLDGVPRSNWDRHTVSEVMLTDIGAVTVAPAADALEEFRRMSRSGLSRLIVVDAGRLFGLISLRDLLSFLSLKLDLEGRDDPDSRRSTTAPHREPALHA
jgi:CBS domain-containing protein